MENKNINSDLEVRSKAWKGFLCIDKEVHSLFGQVEVLHKKAETSKNIGDINSWQDTVNQIRKIVTQITVLQMQQQRRFVELVEIVEIKSDFCYN